MKVCIVESLLYLDKLHDKFIHINDENDLFPVFLLRWGGK
jgi:hypothetical protein